jgi:hypothetical protein
VTDDPARPEFPGVGRDTRQRRLVPHRPIVDGYAIEGHVPAEAIRRLLADRPDAAGLALPGMPSDSPGMGGDQASWSNQPVMLVDRDGSFGVFTY